MSLQPQYGSHQCKCVKGTPEIGGLTSFQGLEIVQGCRGLNLIGADLVEVRVLISLMCL